MLLLLRLYITVTIMSQQLARDLRRARTFFTFLMCERALAVWRRYSAPSEHYMAGATTTTTKTNMFTTGDLCARCTKWLEYTRIDGNEHIYI